MPLILAVMVGAAPITWTVCGLRLLTRCGSAPDAAVERGETDARAGTDPCHTCPPAAGASAIPVAA